MKSNFIKLYFCIHFWSEQAFLPDFMTTVYESHMYLIWDLLKSTSGNMQCFYSSLHKWSDRILKAKEKNYHREAVSLGSHSLIIVITMLIEYFSCAKNSQDFTFMDVYNFPIIIIKSVLLSFYFMVKYKEFEGFEHRHLVKGLWSEHRLTLENLIKYYSI